MYMNQPSHCTPVLDRSSCNKCTPFPFVHFLNPLLFFNLGYSMKCGPLLPTDPRELLALIRCRGPFGRILNLTTFAVTPPSVSFHFSLLCAHFPLVDQSYRMRRLKRSSPRGLCLRCLLLIMAFLHLYSCALVPFHSSLPLCPLPLPWTEGARAWSWSHPIPRSASLWLAINVSPAPPLPPPAKSNPFFLSSDVLYQPSTSQLSCNI